LTVGDRGSTLKLGPGAARRAAWRQDHGEAMQERIEVPKTPVSWFTWLMLLLGAMTILATVLGFYIADPFR
jgi:hypothetical protein